MMPQHAWIIGIWFPTEKELSSVFEPKDRTPIANALFWEPLLVPSSLAVRVLSGDGSHTSYLNRMTEMLTGHRVTG